MPRNYVRKCPGRNVCTQVHIDAAKNIDNGFDKVTKMAGKDWVYGFIKRHPTLALRQTTPTSIARAIGFNSVQVQRFYTNLKECLDKYNFSPGRMYNMDETIEVGEHSPSILAGETESTERPENEMLNTIHHVPLADISPLPKASHIQNRRKNACWSEIVTSSPYKVKMEEQQAEKENKVKRVRKPNIKSMESDKKKRTGKKPDKKNKPGPSGLQNFFKQSQRHTSDYFCPLCYEKFEDPPSEDWIKCIRCESWWHEGCTDYENGPFTCDQCREGYKCEICVQLPHVTLRNGNDNLIGVHRQYNAKKTTCFIDR